MVRKPAKPEPRPLPWIAVIGVGAFALLLYLPTVSYDFTFDDVVIVAGNPAVQQWGNWRLLFFEDYWPGIRSALYRPVTILSFAIERLIHGSEPGGFHFINALVHAGSSIMVGVIAAEFIGFGWPAVAAGLLFAAHPLHSEAVTNVSGRSDLLSTLFLLSAFLLWTRRARAGDRSTSAAALGLYLAALGSKENAIVLPGLILIWEIQRARETPLLARLAGVMRDARFWSLIGVAIAFLLLRAGALGGLRASFDANPPLVENPLAREGASLRILSALANQAHGLRLHLLPHPLIADYSHETLPILSTVADPHFLMMVLFVLGAMALWMLRRSAASAVAFACSWYLIAILPASNLPFSIGTIFAERLLYLPSVGICLAVAFLWQSARQDCLNTWRLRPALTDRALASALLAAILIFAGMTWARNPVWRNDLTLFSDTVEKAPRNAKAHLRLGDALTQAQEYDSAVSHYRKALEIYPQYAVAAANLLVPLRALGRIQEAIETGERARSLLQEENPVLLYNLAVAYQDVGNMIRFLDCISHSLKLDPGNARAHVQLGRYYLQHSSDRELARRHLEEALRLDPNLADAALLQKTLRGSR